jgi:hypothetical protein
MYAYYIYIYVYKCWLDTYTHTYIYIHVLVEMLVGGRGQTYLSVWIPLDDVGT